MRRSILLTVVLGLLITFVVAPFSALAMLMILLIVSTGFWAVATLVQTLITGEVKEGG